MILLIGIGSALATLNAFLPVRTRWLAILGFFAGWLTIELALHILVFNATLIGALAAYGGLERPVGQFGLGLALASSVGLALLHLRSRRAAVTLQAFYAAAALKVGPEAPRYPRLHVLFPFLAWLRRDIEVLRGLEFAEHGGHRLRLDIFRPREAGTLRPALLQVHGGAWVLGFKEYQGIPLLTHMASTGWVGFNVDYRLSPKATFPEHLIDVKRALAWIREHAVEYGVDPDFIVVTGGSAGAHLAALVGLTANDPEYQPGFESFDTRVQAVVTFYGVYDLTNRLGTRATNYRSMLERLVMKREFAIEPEVFARASPIDRVHVDAPPFLVVHGSRDTLTPVEDARHFIEKLRHVSKKPALYIEMQGAEHAFDTFPSVRTVQVIEATERFLHGMFHAHVSGRRETVEADEAMHEITDTPPSNLAGATGS
ncbi:MAG: alpha/beta hydrolase [Nannocystis sp.]|nr:alpha/beta hydrolase [Nannocystis sp.]